MSQCGCLPALFGLELLQRAVDEAVHFGIANLTLSRGPAKRLEGPLVLKSLTCSRAASNSRALGSTRSTWPNLTCPCPTIGQQI